MNLCFATGLAVVLTAASFVTAAPRVIITEIMYNPASSESNNESEWVEIANVGDETIDIKGWRLDDEDKDDWGPFNCTLAPGGVAVLVNSAAVNETEFRGAWDSAASLGSAPAYQVIAVKWGSLANQATTENEILKLLDEKGKEVCQVNYESARSWPALTMAGGPSIYLTDFTATDLNDGKIWRASKDGEAGAHRSQKTKVFNEPDTGSPGYVDSKGPSAPRTSPSSPESRKSTEPKSTEKKPAEQPRDPNTPSGS